MDFVSDEKSFWYFKKTAKKLRVRINKKGRGGCVMYEVILFFVEKSEEFFYESLDGDGEMGFETVSASSPPGKQAVTNGCDVLSAAHKFLSSLTKFIIAPEAIVLYCTYSVVNLFNGSKCDIFTTFSSLHVMNTNEKVVFKEESCLQ